MVVLGLLVALAIVALSLFFPFAGLLCYLSWYLVRPQELLIGFGGAFPLERIIALGLIAGALLHFKFLHPRRFVSHPLNKALVAFLLVNLASIYTSIWMGETLRITLELLKLVILYFLIVNLVDSQERLRKLLWVYLLCMAWTAGSALYTFREHPLVAQGIERAAALTISFGDPNALATSLALALPIGLAFQRHLQGFFPRHLVRSILLLALVCIIFTGSRAGMIQLILIALLVGWKSRHRMIGVPIAGGFLLLVWALMPGIYQERFFSIFAFTDTSTAAGASAYGRIVGLLMSWQMFLDHPLLGVGAGNFPTAWGTLYTWEGRHAWFQAHNLPGQVLSELGLIGALSFAVYVFLLLRSSRGKGPRGLTGQDETNLLPSLGQAFAIVVATLLIGGFFGHNLYRYNWYLVGALTVVVNTLAQRRTSPAHTASKKVTGERSGIAERWAACELTAAAERH